MTIYQVDAFTSKPFKGNPAGVCISEKPLSDELMQNIAMEMNLSETAFLVKQDMGYSLRWFTPAIEVDLCGHATLASAHILFEKGNLKENEKAVFYTKSGILYAKKVENGIELDFPIEEAKEIPIPIEIKDEFKDKFLFCSKNRMDILVELKDEKAVKEYTPNFNTLSKIKDVRGIIITAKSEKYDFVSRFFAPNAGINEDPVTGSAHCCLTPYWSKKLSKTKLNAFQCSKRGGELICEIRNDRIFLTGQAITVMTCEMIGGIKNGT